MNSADNGLSNSTFGPPPAKPKATFPEQPETRIQDDQPLTMEQEPNNPQEHTSHPVPPTSEKHVSKGLPEDEDQLPSEQTLAGDNMRERYPGDERLVSQKRSYSEYREEKEPPQHGEAQTPSYQQEQSEQIKLPPAKKKVAKPEYPCGKNAREQAVMRQKKRHDLLKRHIRTLILKQGYNLEAAEVPPPPPIRRRKTKPQTEESDDSDASIDSDEQEPEAHVVSAKDRLREIGGAVNSASGLTNRRTGSQKEDLKEAKTTFGHGKVKCIGKGAEMLWCLRGMKAHLKPFQLVAVSWMVQRETDDGLHKGGLLADTPGFGKTVMSLGAIIGNPPSPELIDKGYKATLVVVPNVAILKQWEQQIREHLTEENATFYHYKGSQNVLEAARISDMNIV
jgi:SNF2 family DNA or RNA helicase